MIDPRRIFRLRLKLKMLLWRIGFHGKIRVYREDELPPDFEPRHQRILQTVAPYTLTTPERLHALIESVRYLLANQIPGVLVECGVYRGGSMMAAALTLLDAGVDDRELFLFDTFEGMPRPEARDVDLLGVSALEYFQPRRVTDASSAWTRASVGEVREAMALTGYPEERIHYVKGLVEETLPGQAPSPIALLRLDTDFFRSTKHELVHLYPRVSPGGVVIVDDYGHFEGARDAVDEFLSERELSPLLQRIDYSARLWIKSQE